MARIHFPDLSDMTSGQRAPVDIFPSNFTKALLRSSVSAKAYIDLGDSFTKGTLAPQIREAVILRVSVLSHSVYEKMRHAQLANHSGLSEELMECISESRFDRLSRTYQILFRFVDECVANARVSENVFTEAASIFSETDLLDITLLIGYYMMTARFVETFEI